MIGGSLSVLLRSYRVEAELTQEELAQRAGLSARAISDLERGVKIKPHRVTVELLADALQLTEGDRAALLAAVPRCFGSTGSMGESMEQWLAPEMDPWLVEVHPPPSSEELRSMLERLMGTNVGGARSDRRINVTVIMFSVAEPVVDG
jgi:transcriptional regulator with XRE-family HTH domain